jgi:hypothetical protein
VLQDPERKNLRKTGEDEEDPATSVFVSQDPKRKNWRKIGEEEEDPATSGFVLQDLERKTGENWRRGGESCYKCFCVTRP